MDLSLLHTTLLYLLVIPPLALLACIISSTREHLTNIQDRTQLLKIYHQHAILIEVFQYTTVLLILRAILRTPDTRVTTSGLLCSLGLGIANLTTLLTIDAIDAWRLPRCWDEVFDPMFRITRDWIYDCRFSIKVHLSRWIERLTVAETGILPRPPRAASSDANSRSKSGGSASCETSFSPSRMPAPSTKTTGRSKSEVQEIAPKPAASPVPEQTTVHFKPTPPPPAPPLPKLPRPSALRLSRVRFKVTIPPPATPSPELAKSLTSRPHYESQTLSSASRSVRVGAK